MWIHPDALLHLRVLAISVKGEVKNEVASRSLTGDNISVGYVLDSLPVVAALLV